MKLSVTMSDNEDTWEVTSAELRERIEAILKNSYTPSLIQQYAGKQVRKKDTLVTICYQ